MPTLERYVVIMYHRTSDIHSVNEARQELVEVYHRLPERIPPTRGALLEHTKRSVHQGGLVWGQKFIRMPEIDDPVHWGYNKNDQGYLPNWTDDPLANEVCIEFIQCGCKTNCSFNCKCHNIGTKCKKSCGCKGKCNASL